ncbi:MAG: metallophosphoesterase [Anaerolineaceae bacterium]
MKILSLSDVELPAVYNTRIKERFGHIDLAVSCGDLPYYYLEYIITMLNIPLYYVQGNHVQEIQDGSSEIRTNPWGAINLHRQVIYNPQFDLILAGIEGSLRYNTGNYQYSSAQMWNMVLGLVPKLLVNKLRFGRYLDIFVTHSAPEKIQDDTDYAHRGVRAYRWLIKVFKPQLHLHGHIHLYNPTQPRETQFHQTRVINTYGFREITWPLASSDQSDKIV